uniref:Bm10048 n=1 Tax=Brugia malayi TaxID=6279 RepID=A0A0J9XWD4_BRUMA|nr:Bm10048 [Brugia malayi]
MHQHNIYTTTTHSGLPVIISRIVCQATDARCRRIVLQFPAFDYGRNNNNNVDNGDDNDDNDDYDAAEAAGRRVAALSCDGDATETTS